MNATISRALFALLSAACLVSAASQDSQVVRSGAHYKVVCHFNEPAVADAALETIEAVWPLAVDLFGSGKPPKMPELHIYRTIEEYQDVDKKLTGGKFQWNNGFSQFATGCAHVAITPPCSDTALRICRLPPLTRRLMAHEAVHLAAYALMPNSEWHPSWFSEGSACWVSQETLKAKKWVAGDESDPMNATEAVLCQEMADGGTLPPVRDLVVDEYGGIDINQRYAVQYTFFRFLKTGKPRDTFKALLKEIWRLGGGTGFGQRFGEVFGKAFPGKNLDELETDFKTFIKGLAPEWREVYRSIGRLGDEWIQTAFPDSNAICWNAAPAGEAPYRIRGEVEILPGEATQVNVLLGRIKDTGFISVAMGSGYLTVFHYQQKHEEPWERLRMVKAPRATVGNRIPFEILVGKERLAVQIDGLPFAEVDVPAGRSMSGSWGFGAQAGTTGIWRGVQLLR